MNTVKSVDVWRTIRLRPYQSIADIWSALKDLGCSISPWGNDLLEKQAFILPSEEKDIHLTLTTVAGLGWPDGAIRKDIYDSALNLGMVLCPSAVGPHLILQCLPHLEGTIVIGMKYIGDSLKEPGIFAVTKTKSTGEVWLHGRDGDPKYFWAGKTRFVFVLP